MDFSREWEPRLGSRVVGASRPWHNHIACWTMHRLFWIITRRIPSATQQHQEFKEKQGTHGGQTTGSRSVSHGERELSTRVMLREKRGDRPCETGRGASGIILGFNSLKANLPSVALGLVWRVLGEGGLLGASRAARSPLLPRADLLGVFRR